MTLAEVLDHAFLTLKNSQRQTLEDVQLMSGDFLDNRKYSHPVILHNKDAVEEYYDLVNNENTYGLTPITDTKDLFSLVEGPSLALYEYYKFYLGVEYTELLKEYNKCQNS